MVDISLLHQLAKPLLRDCSVRVSKVLDFMMGLMLVDGRVVLRLGGKCYPRVGNLVLVDSFRGVVFR
jgi:hypothetical protein